MNKKELIKLQNKIDDELKQELNKTTYHKVLKALEIENELTKRELLNK
jgi:hypothetical protein